MDCFHLNTCATQINYYYYYYYYYYHYYYSNVYSVINIQFVSCGGCSPPLRIEGFGVHVVATAVWL